MRKTTLCFNVHQPYRLRKYRVFDIGKRHDYFAHEKESELGAEHRLHEGSRIWYRPEGERLFAQLKRDPELEVVVHISGTALEQLDRYDRITLRLYRDLVRTGKVHIASDTYYHSAAFWYSQREYAEQVHKHREAVERLLGVTPVAASLQMSPTWLYADIQRAALEDLYALETRIRAARDEALMEDWRRLQAIDHIQAMDERSAHDYVYMQAHGSPYEAYIAHKSALEDIAWRLDDLLGEAMPRVEQYEPVSLLGV